jgi:UDP-2-acetamido-3-amino-2,3-dideoxy-glucuronate N-acetyltransferase
MSASAGEYFLHPQALCETKAIGRATRVWAFAHILPGARIGADCNICDHVFVENDVVIGDRVTIKSGVQIWDGIEIESDVFVGPNATFTNDRFPRSRDYQDKLPRTRICGGASIGGNATILPGIVVGRKAMIGAGAVVTSDVPPNAIVTGNPARIVGYVDARGGPNAMLMAAPTELGPAATPVRGASIHRLRLVQDVRGDLTVGEFGTEIPFLPKRYFIVLGHEAAKARGEYALRSTSLFMLCAAGACAVVADDGTERAEFMLDRPEVGLFLPPMTWFTQYRHTPDSRLLVFASAPYNPEDYIRDYEAFLAARKR